VTAGAFTPTGVFTFMDGGAQIGTGTLNPAGVATFSTTSLVAGSHNITASYGGDDKNAAAVSTVLIEQVRQPTVVALQSSLNPAAITSSVTFTATVSGTNGNTTIPTGRVVFLDGVTQIGAGALSSTGVATFSTVLLSGGPHNITADFNGDANSAASQSPALIQIVEAAATITTLSSSNLNVFGGQNVNFVAVVSQANGNIPTGSVTLLDGTSAIGTAILDGTGKSLISTATLSPGVHSITAVFGGSRDEASSTSSALAEVVQQIPTTTTGRHDPLDTQCHDFDDDRFPVKEHRPHRRMFRTKPDSTGKIKANPRVNIPRFRDQRRRNRTRREPFL